MKLITYLSPKTKQGTVGILHSNGRNAAPVSSFGVNYSSMAELICRMTGQERECLEQAEAQEDRFCVRMEDVKLLAPVPHPAQDIICLGVNYKEHAQEAARFEQEAFDLKAVDPVYFSKRVNKASGHRESIPAYDTMVDSLDYEAELAVILGKDAKDVKKEDARSYIFGYTILNDVSARNLQTRHSQWYFGKSLDGFAPMGPVLVTEDEIPYPPRLAIECRVNGELRQSANTGQLIHDIGDVIQELSSGMTLKAGTIISTGTPEGVGMGWNPPRFLHKGDEVSCKIERIGTLTNRVGE